MNDNRKKLIFVICYLAYTSIYIARLNLSMTSPSMISRGILTTAQIGFLGSAFSVIYALGRLVNGAISDNRPPWLMISTGLAAAGISNILTGFFPPFMAILLLWSCNAYAQSMLWSSVLCLVSGMYGENIAKRKTAYMVTSVAAGNVAGIVINTFIISKLGVRFAFIIPGILTIIFGALMLLTARNAEIIRTAPCSHTPVRKLFNLRNIRLTIIPAMLHGAIKDNISLWMTVYFVNKFGINLSRSSYFVLFIPIVGFAGRSLYPIFYRLSSEREHIISALSFAACALLAASLCLGGINPAVSAVCLALIYAAVSMINTSILSIFPIQFSQSGNVASVSGIMDFATYLGAGISCFIYGFVIEFFGFEAMFASWAIISLVSAAFLMCLMKNKFPPV